MQQTLLIPGLQESWQLHPGKKCSLLHIDSTTVKKGVMTERMLRGHALSITNSKLR